ncbi:MAG: type IV pilus modification PilV family protein, partial [Phycisphaerales bacterium]
MSRPARLRQRRGFSLIEVLLAVFILGIGIISIGAIFPAGIVQQRQSLDDALGPIVADNALATLRAKLSQTDFGFAEDFESFPLGLLDLASFEDTYGD